MFDYSNTISFDFSTLLFDARLFDHAIILLTDDSMCSIMFYHVLLFSGHSISLLFGYSIALLFG